MSKDLIGIDFEPPLKALISDIEKLPDEAQYEIGEDVGRYLYNIFQEQPQKKRIENARRKAFGVTFFSDKQRRWFFANLDAGTLTIPYQRTQRFRKSWQLIGRGINTVLVNDSEAGPYLMDDKRQSCMSALFGWQKISDKLNERMHRIERVAVAAMNKALKKLG